MEAGVVIDAEGRPIYWHVPKDRSAASLPDSRELWEVLWENRQGLSGFAHSHPGAHIPCPSREDVTTFAAIEAALGRRLDWWITSDDALVIVNWVGPGEHGYQADLVTEEPDWVSALRAVSRASESTGKETDHDRTKRGAGEHHLGRAER